MKNYGPQPGRNRIKPWMHWSK